MGHRELMMVRILEVLCVLWGLITLLLGVVSRGRSGSHRLIVLLVQSSWGLIWSITIQSIAHLLGLVVLNGRQVVNGLVQGAVADFGGITVSLARVLMKVIQHGTTGIGDVTK